MKRNRLYELLPTIYRQRDLREGKTLLAFLNVMETELNAIEKNIAELYDNWFIETCDEWVVPYIGELLGIRNLATTNDLLCILRLQVANTLRNRRQKGTLEALQNAIYESTGWPTKIVPYFEIISITQNLVNICLETGTTIDLHQVTELESINRPSNSFAHNIDVHLANSNILDFDYSVSISSGEYNIKNVGIFLYQLRSFPIQFAQANQIEEGCYTFNAFGVDNPLFMPPSCHSNNNNSSSNLNFPVPLTESDLLPRINSSSASQILVDGDISMPPLQIFILREDNSVMNNDDLTLQVTDLSQGQIPTISAASPSSMTIFVDLKRGRLFLPANIKARKVFVNYAYGFSAEIGGGPYSRRQTLTLPDDGVWQGQVAQSIKEDHSQESNCFSSLNDAIEAWIQSDRHGIIQICDNAIYDLEEDSGVGIEIFRQLQNSFSLTIEAADGFSPCLKGNLFVFGSALGSQLVLNGLWINGTVSVAGNLRLVFRHCTVRGKDSAINYLDKTDFLPNLSKEVDPIQVIDPETHPGLDITISHSIISSVCLPSSQKFSSQIYLSIYDSIIDGGDNYAIASKNPEADDSWGPPSQIEKTTILGRTKVDQIVSANSVIFADLLLVRKQQEGHISFSYVPPGSITPPQYRSQPDSRLANTSESNYGTLQQSLCKPIFVSRTYGNPAYAKLSYSTAVEILTGAENGMEMGVFNCLAQPQRLANLQVALKENFPYGLIGKLGILN